MFHGLKSLGFAPLFCDLGFGDCSVSELCVSNANLTVGASCALNMLGFQVLLPDAGKCNNVLGALKSGV